MARTVNDRLYAENCIQALINYIGDDIKREGLVCTPARVIKSYNELFAGYGQDPKQLLTTFESGTYDQIVLCKDIEFYSTCEHHMMPFYGVAHVAYIPGEHVIGLSKLARLLEIYARRLQIQERIGEQVTQFLMDELHAKGAACILEAKHFCMCARGVNKQKSVMSTSSMKGVFFTNSTARLELLQLIK
jgi:GTP cyclohydrolase I